MMGTEEEKTGDGGGCRQGITLIKLRCYHHGHKVKQQFLPYRRQVNEVRVIQNDEDE